MKKNIIHAIKEYVIIFFYLQTIFSGTFSTNNFSRNLNDIAQNADVSNGNSQIASWEAYRIVDAKRKDTGSSDGSEFHTFESPQKKLNSDGNNNDTPQVKDLVNQLDTSDQSNPDSNKNDNSNDTENNENHYLSYEFEINEAMYLMSTILPLEYFNKLFNLQNQEPSSLYNMFNNIDSKTNEISGTESTLQSNIPVTNSAFIHTNPEIYTVANLSNQNDEISGFFDCKRLVLNLANISKSIKFAINYINVLNNSTSSVTTQINLNYLNKQAQESSIVGKCKKFYISTLKSWNLVIKDPNYRQDHPYLISFYCFLKESRNSSEKASDYLRKMCYWKLIDSYLKKEINSLDGIKLLGNYDKMTDIDLLTIEFLGVTQIVCKNRFLAFIKSYREDEGIRKVLDYSQFLIFFFQVKKFIQIEVNNGEKLLSPGVLEIRKKSTEIETFDILLKYLGNLYWFDINMLKTCLSEYKLAINSFIRHLNLRPHILKLKMDNCNDNPEDGNIHLKKRLQIFRDKFNEIRLQYLNMNKHWSLNDTI
ncbi:hypothetical protein CWI38_0900p0020 [Hamiltosporidium tvaerminnensis]|uniref:Uncharacterized protein n=1 Tax=Hamiltosporidium tvaerminnensis TaxID=1176355 RepID=A0A4Q9LUS3_9MICR|nr:hypothetical protein CWI38_0900p0020 [Hamiltosporidium tvaerminnensis]